MNGFEDLTLYESIRTNSESSNIKKMSTTWTSSLPTVFFGNSSPAKHCFIESPGHPSKSLHASNNNPCLLTSSETSCASVAHTECTYSLHSSIPRISTMVKSKLSLFKYKILSRHKSS